ncbi:2-amino-4-hydroxy-6-hydroxymethyldihydropteridine diphosphokinase [Lentisalinibacter sediminis]|uniref:2-amino-4-hydroxy-6- hydroxymethyldihydropteridine diphosphokinase n=1 Tax=Lentisalinibacter sediminis TaxID=2992237 RepID=UPI003866EB3B
MARVFVSVGSNIRPEENLRLACAELERRFGDLDLSSVYRNPPVGFDGEDFLNLVAGFDTEGDPEEVIAELEQIHRLAGRQRGAERYGPRTLDLDLLLYDDLVTEGPPLTLPRDDVLKYDFVLGPLAELVPDLVHPVDGRRLADLWEAFEDGDRRLTVEDVDVEARI